MFHKSIINFVWLVYLWKMIEDKMAEIKKLWIILLFFFLRSFSLGSIILSCSRFGSYFFSSSVLLPTLSAGLILKGLFHKYCDTSNCLARTSALKRATLTSLWISYSMNAYWIQSEIRWSDWSLKVVRHCFTIHPKLN